MPAETYVCSAGRWISTRAVTADPGCDDRFHDDDGSLCRHTGPAPRYVALDCPAWINGKEVLLVVRKDGNPERRRVLALFPDEARYFHREGRLDGWTPLGESGGAT